MAECALQTSSDVAALGRVLDKVRERGLSDNLIELETQGYTAIKGVLSEETMERARESILEGEWTNPAALSMDLSPGDVVVWQGNTWHGSFARQIPGIRLNLAMYFSRQYLQSQEHHRDAVPEEVLVRHANDERFNVLLHQKQPYGWKIEGPDYALMGRNPRGLYD